MEGSYVIDGVRTPFGRHGGALSRLRPDDMIALNIRGLLNRSALSGDEIEDVIVGDSNQAGEDSRNVARNALLIAGLPVSVSGITVNRLCGSGLTAAIIASNSINCGEGELFIAGGVESMSRAPFVLAKSEHAFDRRGRIADSTIGWRFPNDKLTGPYGAEGMPETAENIAKKLDISREESDAYACEAQMRYEAARKAGFYRDEIMPVEVPSASRKQPPILVKADEHPRPDTTPEKLAGLPALQKNGVVTAGSASGINDGAAALLIGNMAAAGRYGLTPMVKILSSATSGVEPGLMGLGPVPASKKALERAGLKLSDMDLIEINEAFAVQVLGCLKQMDLSPDDGRVNPNGGAIAVGHPLGASGARLLLTASRELQRRKGKYALVSLCIGIGQGIAMIISTPDA